MSFFSKIFKDESKDWFFDRLPKNQTPDNFEVREVDKEKEYLSIILKSMRIPYTRSGFKRFYATVHSFISLSHQGGTRAAFCVSTTPGKLEELDKDNLHKVLVNSKRLLGPIPYLGSDVNIDIGLFSIQSADLLKPFISLLTQVSDLASVSLIKVAEPYIKPLETGIDLLLGNAPTKLETGISTSFNDSLQTGYYVMMCAEKGEVKKEDLIVDPGDFKLKDKNNNPVEKYPYMVIQVLADGTRNDWREIPDIKTSHDKLKQEAKGGRDENIDEAWKVFKRTVQFSDDLIEDHKDQIIKDVSTDLNKKLGTGLTSGGGIELMDLEDIKLFSSKELSKYL